jgi:hypothetical protein
MKYLFFVAAISISLLSCQQKNGNIQQSNSGDTVISNLDSSKVISEIKLGEYASLMPLEVVDSSKENVFEKYGIDRDGNCYSCDLATLRFNKKHIDFVNVCDEKDFYRIVAFSYTISNDVLKISIADNVFTIEKIDDAPLYKFSIEGKLFELKNKRLPQYFTSKKSLAKFQIHDCGDFGG